MKSVLLLSIPSVLSRARIFDIDASVVVAVTDTVEHRGLPPWHESCRPRAPGLAGLAVVKRRVSFSLAVDPAELHERARLLQHACALHAGHAFGLHWGTPVRLSG
jgi:hypothetical protein